VKAHVLAPREDHEVVGLVVKRVAVDVMDDLVAPELPSLTLFDNVPVLRDPRAVN
jgi:hypothetical protein